MKLLSWLIPQTFWQLDEPANEPDEEVPKDPDPLELHHE
jgi:hypothetical protein